MHFKLSLWRWPNLFETHLLKYSDQRSTRENASSVHLILIIQCYLISDRLPFRNFITFWLILCVLLNVSTIFWEQNYLEIGTLRKRSNINLDITMNLCYKLKLSWNETKIWRCILGITMRCRPQGIALRNTFYFWYFLCRFCPALP